MKGFRAKGSFKDARSRQVFTVEVAAANEDAAKEGYCPIWAAGTKLKRWEITIDEIVELAPSDITDRLVAHEVGL
jgi:ribosomal protein L20A (L18A)